MKLKGLEVQGFKTFPDKTKLDFTNGITAVVGPNGSGKSNISDAIRWVLGEQSAKALRCSKMEDVIFNGTQQRKKTGYAQVTLSIDNSDRSLQFDGDEVAVTRRFYRSGNSEYLINNTAVRLQDIHELFMDTGLGRDGYSMIGQGKIDSIVSSKGEDRREIFEEAAGISRFRYKKADAERRLDKTEENLIRLRDILSELEGRVEPLRVQSEKAKAYLEYAEEKRGLEIALWLKTLEKSSAQVREQDDKLTVARKQHSDTETALEKIQAESERLFIEQNNFTSKVENVRRTISDKEEKAAQKKSEISVLQNDILHNNQTIQRIRGEITLMQESGKQLQQEIDEKNQQIAENQSKLTAYRQELQKYTDDLGLLKADESVSAGKLDEINSRLSDLTKKASDARIEYMTASTSIQNLTDRMDTVENQVKARKSQIKTLQNIIADYQSMRDDCVKNIAELNEQIAVAKAQADTKAKDCDRLKAESDRLSLDAGQLFRKAKMLEELENNLEGFTKSVKIIMRESKRGTLSGIHGPVSRVISTEPKYSTAIEIALGAAMQNIVVTNDADAKNAIHYLKQHDGGRATFLPMSTIKGREFRESGLERCNGFVGIASELCTCDSSYNGILSNLLGRIVIAENLDRATQIAKQYGYRFKIVTLDGQVVNAGGSLTGGSLSKNTGLLGRADEIANIRKQAYQISEQSEQSKKAFETAKQEQTEADKNWNDLKDRLAILNQDKVKIETETANRSAELTNTQKAYEEICTDRSNAVDKLNELNTTMTQARAKLDEYNQKIKENEDVAQSLSGSKNEFIRKREHITEKLQEIRMNILTVEKDIAGAESNISNAKFRSGTGNQKIADSHREITEFEHKNTEINKQIDTLNKEIEQIQQEIETAKKSIESLTADRMKLEKRSADLRQAERDKTAERENISGELARLEERRVNLQNQYDEIIGKLWEEYELTRREAENIAVQIEDMGKAQRRLAELKQKIRSLGTVNVSAIEEYKEVSERYEFLKIQIGDVEKSKAELLKLINELTKQMKEIFIERFQLINQNFSSTFVELFGGGKASLSLSDPENVLTTGIDISVEPPGKIVSHIELLSGGEKALVAIALYFAIMKVSPAPFCVMDEIEAALDDVNVYRFAAYLRRMNDNTQFICITHRRGTMEEADVLYGVTMQDRGISKLLELRASEVEQKLGIKS